MTVLNLQRCRALWYGGQRLTALYYGGTKLWPPPVYATVALGIAGVADGARFMVEQPGGYHFVYTRQGAAARFDHWIAITPTALAWEAKIEAERTAYAGLPTTGVRLSALQALRWGGRLVPNLNGAAEPTLNMVDPFFPRDEDANATPARTNPSPATDPLGNAQAARVTFDAVTQALLAINRTDNTSWTDSLVLTLSVRARLESGAGDLGIGSTSRTSGAYQAVTLTSSWQAIAASVGAYSNTAAAYQIGIIPAASGVTTPLVTDLYGLQVYGDTGPIVLPSLAAEKAAYDAQHARAVVARPGSIPIDSDGAIRPDASSYSNIVVPLGRRTFSSYTIVCSGDFAKADYGGSYAMLAAFARQPDSPATNTYMNRGAIGMDTNLGRYGRLYSQPAYSINAARCPTQLLGQGWVRLAVRVTRVAGDDCLVEPFINGVPCYVDPAVVPASVVESLMVGGYDASLKRRQSGLGRISSPDGYRDAVIDDRAWTDSEISADYLAFKAHVCPDQKKQLIIWCGDSRLEFADSPAWDTGDSALVRPGSHFMLDAKGGSFFGAGGTITSDPDAYDAAPRQTLRRRMMALGAAHYDRVHVFWNYGTNDIGGTGRAMSNLSNPFGSAAAGAAAIDAMIQADKASVPEALRHKVRLWLCTIEPRGDWLASNPAREAIRLTENTDRRTRFAVRGYDGCVDLAAWVPPGHASFEAAASDALANGGNGVFQLDGIHYATPGGAAAADDNHIPWVVAQLNDLLAVPQIQLSALTVNENVALGTPVGALSVVNGTGTYTFTITSDPENKFALSGGNLVTDGALDFEADASHAVTIEADNGVDAPISRTFTITVQNLDDTAPTITSAATVNVNENATLVHSLTASEAVTWSIVGGADQAQFELSGSTLRWTSNGTRDFEAPVDADSNNAYIVQVRATDGAGNITNQTITVTVVNIDDVAPTITSSASVSVAENVTLAHSLTANETVTWSIAGGADQAQFEINAATLRWSLNGTRDFEIPADADSNNAYVVQVRATDGAGNQTNQTITVTVTDAAESGTSQIEWGTGNALEWGSGNDLTWGT